MTFFRTHRTLTTIIAFVLVYAVIKVLNLMGVLNAYYIQLIALIGINIDVVISMAFIVGPALAGAGGILYGTTYGMLASPFLGIWPGIKAFIAAVLGGIGNIPGAVLGAYVMGISEAFATSVNSNLGYGIAFVILIAILLIRPSGLLGKFVPEKV